MLDSLGMVIAQDCLDCVQYAVKGSWGEFWVCSGTVALGFFARWFEKRRMKREFRRRK